MDVVNTSFQRMNNLKILLFSFFGLLQFVNAQNYPLEYFRSPLDIPIFLAGNFGEIRSNHFHAGLDMKTESVEGKNIYAVADGYVSRIKISHGGYGKALYITHPNGYTSVYAHLQSFNGEIGEYVNNAQYKKESYEIELFPSKTGLLVKKGELVALSGNSGGSGGPHLHFELRETKTEIPVNPLLFGFDIKDDIKPTIKKLGIYPVKEMGTVNNSGAPKLLELTGNKGLYKLNSTITLSGKIAFGLEVQDKLNGSSNRCGVYSIELLIDSQEVYCHKMDKIGFHETRYINSHVHFYDWKKNSSRIQRSYVQPNNKLNVYNCKKNAFTYDFKDEKKHLIQYIVTDSYGNASTFSFIANSIEFKDTVSQAKTHSEHTDFSNFQSLLFKSNKRNDFKTEDFKISLPANILYDDFVFDYQRTEPKGRAITPIHKAHNIYEPLHSYMTMSIKIDSLPEVLQDKALIVALDEENKFLAAEGGTYNEGWITVKTRSFGPYTVMIDTIAPLIKSYNIVKGRDMTSRGKLQVTVSDELSGLKTYRGTIDGKWILMEYDYKLNLLTYFFDDSKLDKGKSHKLKITASDKQANNSEYSIDFIW